MEFTAKQIAEFIQGSVEGNENASVHTFAKIRCTGSHIVSVQS